ncbi:MAG: hypothetical protein ACE1ZC_03435, partial [Nitrososphaerales archaeon]
VLITGKPERRTGKNRIEMIIAAVPKDGIRAFLGKCALFFRAIVFLKILIFYMFGLKFIPKSK